jgi:uncharacterized protein (TIGR03435 family)
MRSPSSPKFRSETGGSPIEQFGIAFLRVGRVARGISEAHARMVRMATSWIAALAVVAPVSCFTAQLPGFEVASVKPVKPPAGDHVVSLIINHGRLNVEAAELRQIVGLAYGIQRVRVQGGPDWADSDQFDIVAKAENPDATRDEIRTMLQTLLAERFKLVVHRETKQVPAYSLVVAKGGPRLKQAAPDRPSGLANTVGPTGEQLTVFESSPLRILVNMLANNLGGPVLDKTGLDKLYDYTFQWPNADSSLVALLDQLGLKLEMKKEPVEVLLMDRAEHPSAN